MLSKLSFSPLCLPMQLRPGAVLFNFPARRATWNHNFAGPVRVNFNLEDDKPTEKAPFVVFPFHVLQSKNPAVSRQADKPGAVRICNNMQSILLRLPRRPQTRCSGASSVSAAGYPAGPGFIAPAGRNDGDCPGVGHWSRSVATQTANSRPTDSRAATIRAARAAPELIHYTTGRVSQAVNHRPAGLAGR